MFSGSASLASLKWRAQLKGSDYIANTSLTHFDLDDFTCSLTLRAAERPKDSNVSFSSPGLLPTLQLISFHKILVIHRLTPVVWYNSISCSCLWLFYNCTSTCILYSLLVCKCKCKFLWVNLVNNNRQISSFHPFDFQAQDSSIVYYSIFRRYRSLGCRHGSN